MFFMGIFDLIGVRVTVNRVDTGFSANVLFVSLPFWKKVGKYSDHENAGSISRSKRPTDSGPLTTCPPRKICHDSPVLGHIPEIGTSGRRNPCGDRGGEH